MSVVTRVAAEENSDLGIVCSDVEVGQQLGGLQQREVGRHHFTRHNVPVTHNGGSA